MTIRHTVAMLLFIAFLTLQGCARQEVLKPVQPVQYPEPASQPIPVSPQPPGQLSPTIPEPEEISPPTVIDNLVKQANIQAARGNYARAAATLERGLRMTPKNSRLWSELANIKLLQKDYQQAQSFAAKSNSLAGPNKQIRRSNNEIITKAKQASEGLPKD